MRTASLTVLALVAAFLFSVLPAQAAMDHGSGAAHYSDRAFLSGMIAHHEGAVDMAKVFLATPKKDQDPQVTAWADDVIKVQEKEIAEMKELLKPLGGIEESAYAPMKKAMQQATRLGAKGIKVTCGGRPAAKNTRLQGDETVCVTLPDPEPVDVVPQNIPLDIVYEDEDVIVVNKPKGMVVHPAPGNPDGTLVNALLWHCKGSLSGIGGEIRPGIVHRIDKDTSGLLVVAKDDATHIGLSQQMAVHSVERAYQTVVYGGFAQDEGFVEANLGRSKTDRKKMAVYPASEPHTKYAYTGYKVLERFGGFTLLECRLKTGRTHQIRVHMASIQHPVAGDPVYGPHNCITKLHGQCLHAKTLGFIHPITGEQLRFDSELPEYFTHFIASLRRGTV